MKAVLGALSPNIEKDDAWLALKVFLRPWRWKQGSATQELEKEIAKYLQLDNAFAFNSGRSALIAILKSLDLPPQSKALIPGFTCTVAVNPIRWSQLTPVFIEIEEDLNISLKDFSHKAKAGASLLLAQSTFGLPLEMIEIQKIAQENQLIVIEDAAHALGAENQGRKIGTFGQAAFFSLGRDKVISAVSGGIAVTKDKELAKKIRDFQKKAKPASYFWIAQQLLHPILTYFLIIPGYQKGEWGRRLLLLFQKLGILTKAVHKKEKRGEKPTYLPGQLPNALAILGKHQLFKLERFNQHRQKIAQIYDKDISSSEIIKPPFKKGRIYLKYPLILPHHSTESILNKLRKKKIILYDGWQNSPIVPSDTKLKKIGYQLGNCPFSEKLSQKIINLPTHINVSPEQAKEIAIQVNKILSQDE
jgi:perosamine synthetase